MVKTTGGKGLHVVVPVERRVPPEEFRQAASALTALVAERRPDLITDEFRKAKRAGRVMLDPSRNGTGATVVAPYSPRANANATVSFPVDPAALRTLTPADFTMRTVPGLLDSAGALAWKAAASERPQRLPAKLRQP